MAFNVHADPNSNLPMNVGGIGMGLVPLQANAAPSLSFTNAGPRFISPEQARDFAAVAAPKHGPYYNPNSGEFVITQELQIVIIHKYISSKSSLLLRGIFPIQPLTAGKLTATYIDFGAPVAQNAAPFSTPTISGYTKYADVFTPQSISHAVNMEINAMRTREGSIIFNELLVQLQHALFNKFEISLIQALYRSQNSSSIWRARGSHNMQFGEKIDSMEALRIEFECFNACRKDYGLQTLALRIQNSVSNDEAIIPDTILAPYSGILNANLNQTVSTYANNGEDAKRARADAGDNISIPGSQINMAVSIGDHNGELSFLKNNTYIGESYGFVNLANKPVNTIRIWNYATHQWHLIKASDCIRQSGMFDRVTGFLRPDDYDDGQDDRHGGLRYRDTKTNKWTYAKLFGELSDAMLHDDYRADLISAITSTVGRDRWGSIQESFSFIHQLNDTARSKFSNRDEFKKTMDELARQFYYYYDIHNQDYVYLDTPEFKKTAFTYDSLQFICEKSEMLLQYDPVNVFVKKASKSNDDDVKNQSNKYIDDHPEIGVNFHASISKYRQIMADFQLFHQIVTTELPENMLVDAKKDESYMAQKTNRKLSQRTLWHTMFNSGAVVVELPKASLAAFDGYAINSLKIGNEAKTGIQAYQVHADTIQPRMGGEINDGDVSAPNILTGTSTFITDRTRYKSLATSLWDTILKTNDLTVGGVSLSRDDGVNGVDGKSGFLALVKKFLLIGVNTRLDNIDNIQLELDNGGFKFDDAFVNSIVDNFELNDDMTEKILGNSVEIKKWWDQNGAVIYTATRTATHTLATEYVNTYIHIYLDAIFTENPPAPDDAEVAVAITTDILFRVVENKQSLGNVVTGNFPFIRLKQKPSALGERINRSHNLIQGYNDNVVLEGEDGTTYKGQFGTLVNMFEELSGCWEFQKRIQDFYSRLSTVTIEDYLTLIIYFQPFSSSALAKMMQRNVPVPFVMVGLRPVMSFDAHHGFILKRGPGTGVLYISNGLFLQSQDANTGQYTLTARLDVGPAILRPDAITMAKAIHIEKYLAGGGVEFISPEELSSNVENLTSTQGLIPYFIPYGSEVPAYIPLRGDSQREVPSNFTRFKISLDDIINQYPLKNTFWSFFNNLYKFEQVQTSDDLSLTMNRIPMLCVRGAYQYPLENGKFEFNPSTAYIENPEHLFRRSVPKVSL